MPDATWRALTIHRPWTTLIMSHKTIENRSWTTKYRGLVLIHAGVRFDDQAVRFAAALGIAVSSQPEEHPTGVVGVVDLTGVCSTTAGPDGSEACDCGPWAIPGQHHWLLSNPRPLTRPVPARGQQQLWTPSPEVLDAVRAQLAGGAR